MRRTRQERRGDKAERQQRRATRRERMMAGDERYLPGRDRGPERAYARDLIDSRRNIMTMFMPLALLVLIVIFIPTRTTASVASLIMTAMFLIMIVEGLFLGIMVNRRVRERFPDTAVPKLGLGLYAFTRATQLRRLRVPRPRVQPGARV